MPRSGTPGQAKAQRPRKISDEELKAIVDAEIRGAMGEMSGALSKARSVAMERYLGEPDGREMEKRSQVQGRDVLEVIEWILPSLMRIFSTQSAVEIDPVGEEDEQQAQQETDYIRHYFFKKKNGFLILYTWMKDALLQKNGILKSAPVERETEETEDYEAIQDAEFVALASDDAVEITAHTAYALPITDPATGMMVEVPVHDVSLIRREKRTELDIEPLPPEEFGISRDARTVFPRDARFCVHFSSPTVSDLLEEGFSWKDIEQMEFGLNDSEWNEETLERRHLSDEQRWLEVETANSMMQTVKMRECYVKADRNGDGVAELLRVLRSGDYIKAEEIEDNPFDALTPVILTHKFIGLSVADLVMEIQDIRTGLLRAKMDNVHQTINGKTYYDHNRIDPDDMTTSVPHGVVGVNGPVSDAVLNEDPRGLSSDVYQMDEFIDNLLTRRVGDFQSQLDPDVLKDANNVVMLEAINEMKAKVEMIARIFAETGVRELFRRIHKFLRQHGDRDEMIRLRNQWVQVNPSSWRERTDFTVKVGLGTRNKQEAIAESMNRLERMEQALQGPYGMMVAPPHKYWEAQKKVEEALGEANPDKWWGNPAEFQPPPPPPDPAMASIEATLQIEQQKAQLKAAEIQSEHEIALSREQNQRLIAESKAALEQMKAEVAMMKTQSDTEIAAGKLDVQEATSSLQNHVERLELALEAQMNEQKLALDRYKADLDASTKLTVAQMSAQKAENAEGAPAEEAKTVQTAEKQQSDAVTKTLTALMDAIEGIRSEISSPKDFERGPDGRIAAVISNGVRRPIRYDEKGGLVGVG